MSAVSGDSIIDRVSAYGLLNNIRNLKLDYKYNNKISEKYDHYWLKYIDLIVSDELGSWQNATISCGWTDNSLYADIIKYYGVCSAHDKFKTNFADIRSKLMKGDPYARRDITEEVFIENFGKPEFLYHIDKLTDCLLSLGYRQSNVVSVVNDFQKYLKDMVNSSETSAIYFGNEFASRLASGQGDKDRIVEMPPVCKDPMMQEIIKALAFMYSIYNYFLFRKCNKVIVRVNPKTILYTPEAKGFISRKVVNTVNAALLTGEDSG